jgi:hypothetical protein
MEEDIYEIKNNHNRQELMKATAVESKSKVWIIMKKKVRIITALLFCIVLVGTMTTGCMFKALPGAGGAPAQGGDTQDEKDVQTDGSYTSLEDALIGHEMPLEGNPVAGIYITTSGVNLMINEDGSYSWDETNIGGAKVVGTYTIYEGTLKELDDGSNEYVLESDTGPVYTLLIEFDQTLGASTPFTIQVFDKYTEDVFRVTDLQFGTQFEATDYVAYIMAQAEWILEQPENLVLSEKDGAEIHASWDEMPGADGYMIAVLPISFADFAKGAEKGDNGPDPVYQGKTDDTEITISEGLSPGETYTVCVVGTKYGTTSLGAYQDITLK